VFWSGGCDNDAYKFDIFDKIIIACALGVGYRDGLGKYCTANGKRYCNAPHIVIKRPGGAIIVVLRSIRQ
jgi:hypothetical protein